MLGPSGLIKLAASPANALESWSWRRNHQTTGCHQKAAAIRSASKYQKGSCAARCASSCVNIASCFRAENRSQKFSGKPTVGRRRPNAMGLTRRCDSMIRMRREILRFRAIVAMRWESVASVATFRREPRKIRIKRPRNARPETRAAPSARSAPRQVITVESVTAKPSFGSDNLEVWVGMRSASSRNAVGTRSTEDDFLTAICHTERVATRFGCSTLCGPLEDRVIGPRVSGVSRSSESEAASDLSDLSDWSDRLDGSDLAVPPLRCSVLRTNACATTLLPTPDNSEKAMTRAAISAAWQKVLRQTAVRQVR